MFFFFFVFFFCFFLKAPLSLGFNPFMPSRPFYFISLDRSSFSSKGRLVSFLIITLFREVSVFHANSRDPDQTQRSAESVLGLHCLPILPIYGMVGINGLLATFQSVTV